MTLYVYNPLLSGSSIGVIPPDPPDTTGLLVFDLCPELEVEIRYRRRGEGSPPSGGFVQRRTFWRGFNLRVFRLPWINANDAECARMRDLWRRAKGSTKKMFWTPPQEDDSTFVRFIGSELRFRPRTAVAWSIDIDLEEVR